MSSLLAPASQLINASGRTVVLGKVSNGTYNTSTGTVAPSTANHNFKGLVLEYSNRERDGTLIKQGDRKVVLDAKGAAVVPATNDTITINTLVYRIVDVQVVTDGSVDLVYTCQVRQ